MSLANDEADLSRAARVASFAPGVARAGDYLALTKPRVMSLVVFTAAVGLLVAPGHLDPVVGFSALLCIAIGAGAAGALNMWYDADMDALMSRTTARPIPRGRILPGEALAFGLTTAAASVIALGLVTNVAAASLLAFTIFFYIVVYTMWLEALDAAEYRHWRGGRRIATRDRLDRGNWPTRRRAADPISYYLLLDATPFLGLVAQSGRRLHASRYPVASSRLRRSRNAAADPDLYLALGTNFASALAAWLCQRIVRRCCGRERRRSAHCRTC